MRPNTAGLAPESARGPARSPGPGHAPQPVPPSADRCGADAGGGRPAGRRHLARRVLSAALDRRRVLYLGSGAMSAGVYYAVLGVQLAALGRRVPYPVLLVTSQFVASVVVYPWYRLMVFRVSGSSWVLGHLRFYAVGLSFLAASVTGVPLMVELAGIPIMVAQALVIVVNVPLGYVVHRLWTFPSRRKN
ncbi:GtrA family protein [Microbispora amethystogenes]|uniref:GtrA family protein n=1 Tax=Microbispora amethystogenes TaxID=1427754 RepID=UPI003411E8A4